MREIYFHEDDYCQIELVAEANWQFCAEQMGEIASFSERHQAGAGWTDIYVRSANPITLASLAISRAALAGSIPPSMPQFDRVLTGYSSYRVECQRTLAFGPHPALVLFAEFGDDDIVSAVWFAFELSSAEDADLALRLSRSLSRWPVAIADWGWSALLRVTDADALARYFDKRVEVFGCNDSDPNA